MTVLLSTEVLLWWLADDKRLTAELRATIANPRNRVLVSAASVLEAEADAAAGRLTLPGDLAAQIEAEGFEGLPVTAAHAAAAGDTSYGRILEAQARLEGLTLLTSD